MLLGTVLVRVYDNKGVLSLVRAVLDSGPQVLTITLDCWIVLTDLALRGVSVKWK